MDGDYSTFPGWKVDKKEGTSSKTWVFGLDPKFALLVVITRGGTANAFSFTHGSRKGGAFLVFSPAESYRISGSPWNWEVRVAPQQGYCNVAFLV